MTRSRYGRSSYDDRYGDERGRDGTVHAAGHGDDDARALRQAEVEGGRCGVGEGRGRHGAADRRRRP